MSWRVSSNRAPLGDPAEWRVRLSDHLEGVAELGSWSSLGIPGGAFQP